MIDEEKRVAFEQRDLVTLGKAADSEDVNGDDNEAILLLGAAARKAKLDLNDYDTWMDLVKDILSKRSGLC